MSLTIWVPDPDAAGWATLASLPVSFAPGTADGADVLVLAGPPSAWPDPAGRRVVLVDPDPGALPDTPCLLDTPWGSNSLCPAIAEALRNPTWDRLEALGVVPASTDLPRALLQLVSLVRAVGVPLDGLRLLARTSDGVAATGASGPRTVSLRVVRTDAEPAHAVLRALTGDGDVTATLWSPDTARPAELAVTDAAGRHVAPTLWESAHRATWRRLLGAPTDDAPACRADMALVTSAFA